LQRGRFHINGKYYNAGWVQAQIFPV